MFCMYIQVSGFSFYSNASDKDCCYGIEVLRKPECSIFKGNKKTRYLTGIKQASVSLCLWIWESILTCGKGKELSPNSQHSTEQAFERRKPKYVSMDDFPTIVSLVQIITATLLFHIVPEGESKVFLWLGEPKREQEKALLYLHGLAGNTGPGRHTILHI